MGDLVIDHNAGIYISKEDYGEGTNVIGVGNIYDRDIFDGEIYRLGPVNDDKFILDENDILYGESSLVPEGIARTVCVGKNGAGSAFAWHTRRVKLDKNIVNSHVATLELNYLHDIRKYLVSVSTQTALTGMTTEGYFGVTLTLPSVEEQQKISDYFKNIDHFITLHQRKCDETKRLKKYMLQKMFPQNGEKVPEIRFSGFTDDWEQRKLGELAEIVGGGTPSTSVDSYWDGDIDWYAPAEIGEQIYLKSSQRKITEEGLNKSSAKVLPVGTVLFTSRAGIGKTAILLKEGCTNQGFQSIVPNKNKLDSYFIFTRSEELKRYGETVGAGSTFVEVSGKQMANMELMMPTTMDEQQKIGEYFSNLDNLITLHQQKCDELRNIKKFMLQNMFI